MEGKILSLTDFLLEWLVDGVFLGGELPEDGEFLDGPILFLTSLLVFHVLDYDVGKDSGDQHVEKFELGDDLLRIDFLVEDGPEILDDFLAVGIACII